LFATFALVRCPPSFPTRRSSDLVPGHDRDAAGIAPEIHGREVGITRDDADVERIDPQDLGHDVGEDRIRSLPDLGGAAEDGHASDRKSTRLNPSHGSISYAVF